MPLAAAAIIQEMVSRTNNKERFILMVTESKQGVKQSGPIFITLFEGDYILLIVGGHDSSIDCCWLWEDVR